MRSRTARQLSHRPRAGALRAARRAFAKAGLDPSETDLVTAHATSTPAGDMEELAAIRSQLGDHAPSVSVTAIKGAIGHTIGAAGAHAAVAAIQAMRHGCIPPTLNLTDPDPAVGDMDVTPLHARQYVTFAAIDSKIAYLHICEGAVCMGNGCSNPSTGRLISYIVSDFLKARE